MRIAFGFQYSEFALSPANQWLSVKVVELSPPALVTSSTSEANRAGEAEKGLPAPLSA
jgi:hypothetical protein